MIRLCLNLDYLGLGQVVPRRVIITPCSSLGQCQPGAGRGGGHRPITSHHVPSRSADRAEERSGETLCLRTNCKGILLFVI